MDPLDGNAIAGLLCEVLGQETTTAVWSCAHCGEQAHVAEALVHVHAPGVVARCRRCQGVLMVFVQIRGITCVDLAGLASLTPPS